MVNSGMTIAINIRNKKFSLTNNISTISANDIKEDKKLRNGEIVYVKLKEDKKNIYVFNGAQLEKPENGLFIRGRVHGYSLPNTPEIAMYKIKYGIEAFFAPKEKALMLERKLRNSAVAEIMIAQNGKATLKDIVGVD